MLAPTTSIAGHRGYEKVQKGNKFLIQTNKKEFLQHFHVFLSKKVTNLKKKKNIAFLAAVSYRKECAKNREKGWGKCDNMH